MIQIFYAWILSFRMVCLRLDVTVSECLEIWRNRPAIVVVLGEPSRHRRALIGRINQMYPY